MKKQNLINLAVTAALLLPMAASAFTPIPQGTGNISLSQILQIIINAILMIGGAFAVIMFVWAGIKFLTAQGAPDKVAEARNFFLWGVVGVAVMIIGTVIVTIVANLLNGSL